MLVPEAEQDWPPRSPRAGESHDMLLDQANTVMAARLLPRAGIGN
jgi:hypothetical protein